MTGRTIDGTDFDQKMAFVSKKSILQLITPLLYPTIHTYMHSGRLWYPSSHQSCRALEEYHLEDVHVRSLGHR